ncbi:MAG TPA: nucleotidyltransferase family protein, partial [Thermoanaerobaculia bacterium]|nr:nucleotidyltransferase family protein [Thermoanaerobaculia bacterium]
MAVILAAGGSSRLGTAKQLLPFRGKALLQHAIETARAACEDVRVVVNPTLRDAARGVEVVINEKWEEGLASSIRRGLEGIECDVLLMLCDQPLVTPEHLRALISAGAPIAATGYRGIAGVPAFFAARFLVELRALRGDHGARRVIEKHGAVTIPF